MDKLWKQTLRIIGAVILSSITLLALHHQHQDSSLNLYGLATVVGLLPTWLLSTVLVLAVGSLYFRVFKIVEAVKRLLTVRIGVRKCCANRDLLRE